MMQVCLTGGIGSGKTTVAKVLESMGVPVFYADDEAKKLYTLPQVRSTLSGLFGDEILTPEGVDKKKLASLVFSNPEALTKVNELIHPAVAKVYQDWLVKHKDHAFTVKEAAILFESGAFTSCDKIICVTAPEELRIKRVMEREKTPAEEVKKRIRNQWPEIEKIKKSDFVVVNDGKKMILPQLLAILKQLNHEQKNSSC